MISSSKLVQVQQTQQMRRHYPRETRSIQKATLHIRKYQPVPFPAVLPEHSLYQTHPPNKHISSLLQALLHSLFHGWSWGSKEVATTPWFRASHTLDWLEQLLDAPASSLTLSVRELKSLIIGWMWSIKYWSTQHSFCRRTPVPNNKAKITAMSITSAAAGSFSVQLSWELIYSSTEQVEITDLVAFYTHSDQRRSL